MSKFTSLRAVSLFSSTAVHVSLACLCWLSLVFAAAGQPSIVVKRGELDHNVGNLAPGVPIEYEVVLENQGDKAATLKQNKRSCGHCEPLEFNPASVEPGKTAIMKVREKSGFMKGVQVRRSFVDTNDPKRPKFEVVTPDRVTRNLYLDTGGASGAWILTVTRIARVIAPGFPRHVTPGGFS